MLVALLDEADPLVDAEQRLVLARREVDDGDDDLVEQLGGARDDVEVAVGDRVVGARDRRQMRDWGHAVWMRIRVSP